MQPKKDISESLVLLAEFIDSYGRLPRNSAETPEELRLYRSLVVNYILKYSLGILFNPNIFEEGELIADSVVSKMEITTPHVAMDDESSSVIADAGKACGLLRPHG